MGLIESSKRQGQLASVPQILDISFNSPKLAMLREYLRTAITRSDVEELKCIAKPTPLVLQIIQAFCMLMQIQPARRPLPDGSIVNDFFKAF